MTLADLQTSTESGIATARLSGEIDMSNAAALLQAITTATPNDVVGVALDMTDVDYLDSAGIHLLYRLRESLNTRGQALRLVIPEASLVTDTLRLAGVREHMDIVPTLDEAVQALRATGA
jgi:anti-anti-sigma factor